MLCWFEENINLRRKGREYKEKKENIWPTEKRKNRKEKKQIFGQRKYLVHGGEKERRRKGGKHLKKENIWSTEEKKRGEGKDESFGEGKLMVTPTNRQPSEYRAICLSEIRNWKKGRDFQNTQCRTESWEYFQIV